MFNDQSGKLICTAQFMRESLPEMTLMPSLNLRTFTEILLAFHLPSPRFHDDGSFLKLPLLEIPLCDLKSLDSPALTLTQISPHLPEMVVSKISLTVGKKINILSAILRQHYVPDVFIQCQERFKPCVSILNPYGKVPEIQLAVHFTANVCSQEEAHQTLTFNISLVVANSLSVSQSKADTYTLTITNCGTNDECKQHSVLFYLLEHFGCPFNASVPSCVQEILSNLKIRSVQLFFSTSTKTLQHYEMYCSIKQFDIVKDTLSAKEVFVHISFSRSERVHIQCKGLLSLLGSEHFPLDFSLPTLAKPALINIDSFLHELTLLSLFKSQLWGTLNQEDEDSEVLLKCLTPDTRAVLTALGLLDIALSSLKLEITQCATDDPQRSALIVSNAVIKLNVAEHFNLRDLIELEDIDVTIEVVRKPTESLYSFQVGIAISGTLSKCLCLELSYDSKSCCFTGVLSANACQTNRATALCVIENFKAGYSTPVYKHFADWTKQITILATKFMGTEETRRFYDSLSISHAKLSIKYTHDQKVSFILDSLQMYLINLFKDHYNAFAITDLQFEYITSDVSQLHVTGEDHEPQEFQTDELKTCATLTGILFVGNKRLKVVFDLAAPLDTPTEESKELTCTIQPLSDTESLSLSTMIEIARCNQPQLPDIEIPTNIYELNIKKGFVVFGFSPFKIKRFDVFLSAAPNWIVNQSPFVEFKNIIFRILFDSEKSPETACQVSFECILILCDTPVPIVGFISKESVKASAHAQQESDVYLIDFQSVLNQWPPNDSECSYQLPTDINVPNWSFSSSRLLLDILLEKEFKQVKFEASTSNKWLIDLAVTSSRVATEPEDDLDLRGVDDGKCSGVEISSLGYFLNFQVSDTSDGYLALLFGELQLANATLDVQMILGTEKLVVTSFICREDLKHEVSLPSIADQYVKESIFIDPETTPKSVTDKLVPSIALLHIDIRTKQLVICGKLNDSSSSILRLKYSCEGEQFLCTVVLILDSNFRFEQVSKSLAYVDDVMSVRNARLLITNEECPFVSVINDVSATTKGTCEDYRLYESHAADSRIPLPSKILKSHEKCTHVRSSTTDKLVKEIGQSFTLWPFLQSQSSYTDPLQSGLYLYATFDVKSAESTSPPIENALKIITKPDLRDTQLVVIAKFSNLSDYSEAAVKFSGHLEEIELSGSLLAQDVAVSFEMSKSRMLYNFLLNCTLHVQPIDEFQSLSFKPLIFSGSLDIIDKDTATFEGREEHSASALSVSQFEIDPCKTGSQAVTNLSIVVKYDTQFEHFPQPLVFISGFATNFLGFLEAQAELVLIGSTFRLFRINITTEADFYAFLKAQNLCSELLIDPDMITVHEGQLYFSRCSSDYQYLPDVNGSSKPYRSGLWLYSNASLLNEQFVIEVCFPVSGNNFAIMGGKKEKVRLGFINLTNDTFNSGPQLELTQTETGSAVSLNVGVELWGIPWFKGKLTFKPKGGKYLKTPGFEASIECVKKIFNKELKVAVSWSLKSGFKVHELPLKGTLDTLMSLSGFMSQWQIVARLAYALINMSRVRVSVKGKLRMETRDSIIPDGCDCVFVWDGKLKITGKNKIKIKIELPQIPIAIRKYVPSRHPNLISYLFDCLWSSTDLIAKSVLNYLCSRKRFYRVIKGVYDTLKQTVKNVADFIPKKLNSFLIGQGNSFWVLNDENQQPVAYCEHHSSKSPYAQLYGRPLAMKAIQEVATVMLSNAKATNELAHENGPSTMVSSAYLDAFEKYIYQIKCKAEEWSRKVLIVDCVKIDVEQKTIKWKMGKTEPEPDVKKLFFHIRVLGTQVLESSSSLMLQENCLIFETPSDGTGLSKDSLKYDDDGWIVLDLSSVSSNTQVLEKAQCIAVSVYASVVNNVTVLPPNITEETMTNGPFGMKSTSKNRKKIEDDFKKEGWKNEVHIRGSCCYTECMTKQAPITDLAVSFNENIQYSFTDNQIVGSINSQLPTSSYCIVQLYNTEDCTDILWQKLLQDNNFVINVKDLPNGSSSGPYKLRAIVVASDCSLQSEFVFSKFEISRCDSPQCIAQKTEQISPTGGQSDAMVLFSWKEPNYFQRIINKEKNNSEPTDSEDHKVDYTYKFSAKLKESGLVVFDGSTKECEFKCQLKDLFQTHGISLTESVNLSFEVATLGDMEKLDSIPLVTDFIVLAPPTEMEISPPSDDFGVHLQWKFAENTMSYLIKLVNTTTGLSKTVRNHIPEQKLGKKYLKGEEQYQFDSEAFNKSNTEDDIFVVRSATEESSSKEEPEEDTDTLALLTYVDFKQFLQMEPATYKIQMYSSGDGDKCIQSLTPCTRESSNEQKIQILSSDTVQLKFDYKTERFKVVVQNNQVFANGHVVELLMETKDEEESPTMGAEYLAKRIVYPNYTDSTYNTVFRKWEKMKLKSRTRLVAAVSSTCVNASDGVSCTMAQSCNTLKVLPKPSNVTFTYHESTLPVSEDPVQVLSTSTEDPAQTLSDSETTVSQAVNYNQKPLVRGSPPKVTFNTIDDLIVTYSSGDIVVTWEGEGSADGAEFVVGFLSEDRTKYLYRAFNSSCKIACINLDELRFRIFASGKLFVQLADNRGLDVTSPFAFYDQWFHCIKASVRVNRQWKFSTFKVVFTTESVHNIYTAILFRNYITFSTAIKSPPVKTKHGHSIDCAVVSSKNFSKGQKLSTVGSTTNESCTSKLIGSSQSELARIRFKLAKKLIRKLKCQYAFLCDTKTSDWYEYLVLQSSRQPLSHKPPATTTPDEVNKSPRSRVDSKSDKKKATQSNVDTRKTSIQPGLTGGKKVKGYKPPVPPKPPKSSRPSSQSRTTRSPSLTNPNTKSTNTGRGTSSSSPHSQPARGRSGSQQQNGASTKGSPGTSGNRSSKVTGGGPNGGRSPSHLKKGKGAPVKDDPKSKTGQSSEMDKPPSESPTGFFRDKFDALVNYFSEKGDKKPDKPKTTQGSSSPQRERGQQGGAAKNTSILSKESSSGARGSPSRTRTPKEKPVTSTHKKQSEHLTHDFEPSSPTLIHPDQLLDQDDTAPSKWVFVEPATYDIILKASEYNIECPLSVARTLPNGNIATLVKNRKLWFALVPANEAREKETGFRFEAKLKNCKALKYLHTKSWVPLAVKVGLPADRVKSISLEMDPKVQRSLFIKEWSKYQYKPSWDKLVSALKSLELHKVATNIWKAHAVSPGKGYLPIFYHNLLRLSKFTNKDSTYTLKLEGKDFKHPTLSTTQNFGVLIHARCRPELDGENKLKTGPTWFKLKVAIHKQLRKKWYHIRTEDKKLDERSRGGRWSIESTELSSISKALIARCVKPNDSETLEINLKVIQCKVETFEALVVPS